MYKMKCIVKAIWVNLCDKFLIKLSKTRRCFIATIFQLCFRICHQEGPGKQVVLQLSGTHHQLVYADDLKKKGSRIEQLVYRLATPITSLFGNKIRTVFSSVYA
jgi:hypothetical protein